MTEQRVTAMTPSHRTWAVVWLLLILALLVGVPWVLHVLDPGEPGIGFLDHPL